MENQIRILKMVTGMKPSVSNLRFLFCPCIVRKEASHVDTKSLTVPRHSQKGFWGIFIGIPQHQKGYLIYVPSTEKTVSSHDVVFDETFSSELAYTSRPYSEALVTQSEVLYIPNTISYHEQTGDIITFEQFGEGNLVENECNVVEYESILGSIDESSTDNDSDEKYISTNALEDICNRKYVHPYTTTRYSRLKNV